MVKMKGIIFLILTISFLLFSFYPTIFELSRSDKLADPRREFILEHNYYWPDYNLYLSKIRQGIEGHFTAVEKYTSELHQGSLIQEFYVGLGWLGKIFHLDPNSSYLLGRIILAPLLLIIIFILVKYYFPDVQTRFVLARQTWFDRSFIWQVIAFLIVVTSGSFPHIYQDTQNITHVGRFMDWWSNIDALQRITFIPHILFGQVVSFYLLYQLAIRHSGLSRIFRHTGDSGVTDVPQNDQSVISTKKLILLIFLGNLVGIVFLPSLITLNTVLFLIIFIRILQNFAGRYMLFEPFASLRVNTLLFREVYPEEQSDEWVRKKAMANLSKVLFIIFTIPSLLYIFIITKIPPWSALVDFHRTHPMMIPFDQYILGTGPIFFLGLAGAIISIIKRDKKWQPLIFWILATFGFAAFFSVAKDQSPLRFTQTGLFIPLGLLGTYFFYQLFHLSNLSYLSNLDRDISKAAFAITIFLYILGSLFMMKTSLDWQLDWITQRVQAFNPDVPYPPQSMYPLKSWMDGIRWLKNNTERSEVVLAEITAGNHIPAYSGNTVYFGQSNTVDYDRKEKEVDQFFRGKMTSTQAQLFLKNGRIKYVFYSLQEKDPPAGEAGKSGGKKLSEYYPFLKQIFNTPNPPIVTIYNY